MAGLSAQGEVCSPGDLSRRGGVGKPYWGPFQPWALSGQGGFSGNKRTTPQPGISQKPQGGGGGAAGIPSSAGPLPSSLAPKSGALCSSPKTCSQPPGLAWRPSLGHTSYSLGGPLPTVAVPAPPSLAQPQRKCERLQAASCLSSQERPDRGGVARELKVWAAVIGAHGGGGH